ncbi:hypothetical protein [Actinomadura atramentaria]|uniref:hypothetical protein n=1 Tax=Actinomadura atramentaria TaxID=1990 RepID=UPI00037C30B7|nr:hypothetical protein [Actinomadura atramentaria]
MSIPPPPGAVPAPLDAVAAELPPDQRPNPEYATLYRAYSDAWGGLEKVRSALDPAVRTFGATDAWLGPEARAWGGDLERQRSVLRRAADQILWDIYGRLSSTARTIPKV